MSAPSDFGEIVVAGLISGGWPPSVARSLVLTRASDGRFAARLGVWTYSAPTPLLLVQLLNANVLFPDLKERER